MLLFYCVMVLNLKKNYYVSKSICLRLCVNISLVRANCFLSNNKKNGAQSCRSLRERSISRTIGSATRVIIRGRMS